MSERDCNEIFTVQGRLAILIDAAKRYQNRKAPMWRYVQDDYNHKILRTKLTRWKTLELVYKDKDGQEFFAYKVGFLGIYILKEFTGTRHIQFRTLFGEAEDEASKYQSKLREEQAATFNERMAKRVMRLVKEKE